MTEKLEMKAATLRMSEDLRRHLKQEAKRNHRSLNSEIIARLEQSRHSAATIRKPTKAKATKPAAVEALPA